MYTFDFASSARLCLQTKLPLSWQRAMLYQKVLDRRQGLLSQWQCRLAARTLSWWFPGNNGRKSMFWKFIWKRVLHRFSFIRITWLRPLPRDSSQFAEPIVSCFLFFPRKSLFLSTINWWCCFLRILSQNLNSRSTYTYWEDNALSSQYLCLQ